MSGMIYLGINGHVAALEAGTGREVWRTKLQTGFLNATACQDVAVVDDGPYVFAGCHGLVFCMDADTGAVLWQNSLRGMGYNDVSLSIAGKAVISKTTEASSNSSSRT